MKGIVMIELVSVSIAPDKKISKYYYILYGLKFIRLVLEQDPGNCIITDSTKLSNFGIDIEILKDRILLYYGYDLPDIDMYLWEILQEIENQFIEPT
jgi:hypothetical protein